jgi:hypothetical protein
MSTSLKAFNDMLEQFGKELIETFPEEKCLKKYQIKIDMLRTSNPRKCVMKFMKKIKPYSEFIMKKDDSFFMAVPEGQELPAIVEELNLHANWTPDLSQKTKDAIWQYLQTLYMLGTTITSIPPETMDMIEVIAKQCAEKMGAMGGGEGGAPIDEKAFMSSLSGMSGLFGNLLNKN